MAMQRGKDILLKLKQADGDIYETIGGMRASEIAFNAQPVDVTNANSSGRWREFLSDSGMRTARISGEGVFRDETADEMMRALFFDSGTASWELTLPDFGVLSGEFALTVLNYAGNYDGEVRWRMELQSAGEINFAAL